MSNETASAFIGCWLPVPQPSLDLLTRISAGPLRLPSADITPEVATAIRALRRESLTRPAILIGAGTCGLGAGAGKTLEAVRAYLRSHQIAADVVEVGCVGLCSVEPLLDVQMPGRTRVCFGTATADKALAMLESALAGKPAGHILGQYRPLGGLKPWDGVAYLDEHPFLKMQRRLVLAASGIIDPSSIDEYIATGGYSAIEKLIRTVTPEEVCDAVEKSGLRGRGGGGFPAGKKWKLARANAADQKYLICNADEGDPGAFMDRAVGESDPHRLLEGMMIAAYGIGASKAYIYIRAEYPVAVKRLAEAIEQSKQYGLLGKNILGSGFELEIKIKMGAGAFVCGEETALMQSIEGKRGMPRPRPPYPAQSGLFGKPTVINNVETLANLPAIMQIGWHGFAAMGTAGSKGTKVFALSGMVERTGLVEVPMGTSIRNVVFDVGGGIPNRKKCKAVQIGGPSGGCIPEAHFEVACDYEALKEFGAIMGSGGLVVMDESTCMVDLAKFFMEFIQSESCGKCIPCREGTRRMLEILEAVTRARHHEHDIDALLRFQGIMALQRLGDVIKSTSLCGLGQTAPNPVLSTLRWFREEYEAHILERRCPAGACKELVGAPCQTGCPVGTEVWRYVAHIGRQEYADAYRAIRAANPFPSACARVCNHPCESKCRAGTTGGEPVAIRALKRYVVDTIDAGTFTPVVKPTAADAPRVAVIGGGPAGLTAAHQLSLLGVRVTVFEKEKALGGMLTSAIPAYRLPRAALTAEINGLLNPNIEVRLATVLGRDITLEGLRGQGYQAVYLAMGAHKSKRLDVPGEDVKGVIHGIDFLKAYNLDGVELARGQVGIVGGGNSAVDAARVALRQKGVTGVTVYYRRTRDEMPAYAEEIEAALEEGIVIIELATPVEVTSSDGVLRGLRLLKNRLGERDASGRARPVPIAGSEYSVELDTLIVAISEEPDSASAGEAIARARWGGIQINPESQTTNIPGVFAGGDVVTGPSTVIAAVAAGKNAAVMIERYLTGKQLKLLPKVKLPTVYVEPLAEGEEDEGLAIRIRSPHLPLQERAKNFKEVELCVSEQAAVCEARRCLRCDLDFTRPA
jgi:NADH-quinone oxidoreductase subunit F